MAACTSSIVATSAVVLAALFGSLGSVTTTGVCLWTFTNCSNSTWTDLQGIDIGGCCGGNESEQNGTVCGRQRGRMANSNNWQEWTCLSGVSADWARQCQPCGNCTGNSSGTEQRQLCCRPYTKGNVSSSRQRFREDDCGGCCPGNESETIPYISSLAPTPVTNKTSMLSTNINSLTSWSYLSSSSVVYTAGPVNSTANNVTANNVTAVPSSPLPMTNENDGFWSEFRIGIAIAIIAVPLLLFIPIIVGVIVCAVRIHYRKLNMYRMGKPGGHTHLSPTRVRSNMPQLLRPSGDGPREVSMVIDNPNIPEISARQGQWNVHREDHPQMVPRQLTQSDNPDGMPVATQFHISDHYPRSTRRTSENILYEPSDDTYAVLPAPQQSDLESSFSVLNPMYQSQLPIDQRPQHPLPPTSSAIPMPHAASHISQPLDLNKTGLLVTNVSPTGENSTFARVGSVGISHLLREGGDREFDNREQPSSSRLSDIDPGYETLSKYTIGTNMSISPPRPTTSPTEIGGLPDQAQVHTEPPPTSRINDNEDEPERPSVDPVMRPRHTYINEPLTVSTLPSDPSSPHRYTKMALHQYQGSRENIQIQYNDGRITAVANPMYSYPLHHSRSLSDLTNQRLEGSLVRQLQAMRASIDSDHRSTGEGAVADDGINPEARIMPVQSVTAPSVGIQSDVISGGGTHHTYCIDV